MLGKICFYLLALSLVCSSSVNAECPTQMLLPSSSEANNLSRNVSVQVQINDENIFRQICSGSLHVYFLQKSTGEQGIWHVNARADCAGRILIGDLTLGRVASEIKKGDRDIGNYIFRVVVSRNQLQARPGAGNTDVVTDSEIVSSNVLCEDTFPLIRVR